MARRCKRRRICAEPICGSFGPKGFDIGSHPVVSMELDEYECIRLIDYLGFTQEECAKQMDVARTTVQAIYASARRKLAECLVQEKELRIEGGEYFVCEGGAMGCGKRCHHHCQGQRKKPEDKEEI